MVESSAERKTALKEKHTNKESSTMLNDQAIELNFVRNRLETFQDTILRDVQKRISATIDEVMQELRKQQVQINEFRNFATPLSIYHNHNSNSWNNRMIATNNVPTAEVSLQKESPHDDSKKELTLNEKMESVLSGHVSDNGESTEITKSKKYRKLPDKIFITRESFLTALLEVDHMKTIYYIFYIIVLSVMSRNTIHEYFVKGSLSFGLGTFRGGFQNIHKVAYIWILQHVFVFSVYFALIGWSHVRAKLNEQKKLQRLWSVSCLLIYITTQLVFAYLPTKVCFYLNLPFITASVLLLETIRLLMKMHSFVRTITPRIQAGKLKAHQPSCSEIVVPNFNKYLYYLFAPTLLYRDEYPRTATIRWKFALSRLFEIVAIAFLYSSIYEWQIKPHFENFGKEPVTAAAITMKLFSLQMPSVIIFLTGFYMILHAWLNFTAELLRFGDRMFYRDWWTVSNYQSYYRNWNVVVHDWLYEYIYKDFYNHVFKGSKALSLLIAFIISALVHEYILGYALQVFFPVMFAFFGGVGVVLIFLTRYVPKNVGNFILWFSLIYGNGWLISLYSMEYFTRINCPKELNSWTDYLVPHVWSC